MRGWSKLSLLGNLQPKILSSVFWKVTVPFTSPVASLFVSVLDAYWLVGNVPVVLTKPVSLTLCFFLFWSFWKLKFLASCIAEVAADWSNFLLTSLNASLALKRSYMPPIPGTEGIWGILPDNASPENKFNSCFIPLFNPADIPPLKAFCIAAVLILDLKIGGSLVLNLETILVVNLSVKTPAKAPVILLSKLFVNRRDDRVPSRDRADAVFFAVSG